LDLLKEEFRNSELELLRERGCIRLYASSDQAIIDDIEEKINNIEDPSVFQRLKDLLSKLQK